VDVALHTGLEFAELAAHLSAPHKSRSRRGSAGESRAVLHWPFEHLEAVLGPAQIADQFRVAQVRPLWPPPMTTTSKRVLGVDLDIFTVYKSSALILL
jgi:hypothetical protein